MPPSRSAITDLRSSKKGTVQKRYLLNLLQFNGACSTLFYSLLQLVSSRSQTVKESGLKHGDMIYLKHIAGPSTSKEPVSVCSPTSLKNSNSRPLLFQERSSSVASIASTSSSSFSGAAGFSREPTPSTSYGANASAVLNGEDSVDIELYKQDGRIQRKRDEKL